MEQWLKTVELQKYWEIFQKHSCTSFELLAEVEEKDLDDMKIPKIPKRVLLKKIQELKQQPKSANIKAFGSDGGSAFAAYNNYGGAYLGNMNTSTKKYKGGSTYSSTNVVNNTYPVDPKATSGKWLDKEEIPDKSKFEAITGIYKQEAFVPVKFLKDAYYCQEAVCRIVKVSDQGQFINAHGTGFLVTKNHIMTNNHVIASLEEAKNMHFQFFFEAKEYFTCVFDSSNSTPFITEPSLDVTIVPIKPLEISADLSERWQKVQPIPMPINPTKITKGIRCNIVGHPCGFPKLLSIQKNVILKADDKLETIRYTADTDGGSSGSPVFDNNWQLIALHHKEGDEQFIDHVGGYRFIDNEGIRIDRIVKYLKAKLGPNFDILFAKE